MATVFDVAKYIFSRLGSLPAMKLQKLCYYSQAWSLVWEERPLFGERIEAWANGPVVPDLFHLHKGQFVVEDISQGNAQALSPEEVSTVEGVIKFYSPYNSQQLSDLTHVESPWINARRGVPPGQRSNNEITHEQMHAYYSSLR